MKLRYLPVFLALLSATTLLTPATFAKDKKKTAPPSNLDENGVDRNQGVRNNLDENGVDRNQGLHNYAPQSQEYQQVRLKIENRTGQVVGLYYVSPRGTLENFNELRPDGKRQEVIAFPGQTWVFKIGRQVIQQYRATGEPKQSIGGGSGSYTPYR